MECHTTQFLKYGDFSDHLHGKVSQGRIPLNGSFEVTARCNLRCRHCYIPLAQRAGSSRAELSLNEIKRIFSEIADRGCLWLLLTGGEPFLRKDFLEIYDDAKHKGFLTTIFTNGTLLTEAEADHLAEWRPFVIEISLYGATQATYERVTGIPGSFARCMRGIELLLDRGLPLKLKSVLINLNQHELQEMQRFAESLGVEFRFDPLITASLDGDLEPTLYRLSPEQITHTEKQDPYRSLAWPEEYKEVNHLEKIPLLMYDCGAGRSGFHIDAYGKLCLCISARTPNYDLRHGSFQEGWGGFMEGVLTQEYSQSFTCIACELRPVCAQCPAMGLAEFGDPEARVPFICQLATLRNEIFGIQEDRYNS